MTSNTPPPCPREYDFALIVAGVDELSDAVQDALFDAGCDDATPSIQHGRLYLEFSRSAWSLQEAIFSAIADVHGSGIGATVVRVDECNWVTAAEIARRIGRSRELVRQYIAGIRGPGGFPPPGCYLAQQRPLWSWCEVSLWLSENNILRREQSWDAEVVWAINSSLDRARQQRRRPQLVEDIERRLQSR